jgi:hypothetical protein
MTPSADACEEVPLPGSGNVGGLEVSDASVINSALRDVSSVHEGA